MAQIRIEQATLMDTYIVAKLICWDDMMELSATRNPHDSETLALDAMRGDMKFVAYVDGTPAMVYGATFLTPSKVIVWGFKTLHGVKAIREVTKHIKRSIIPSLRSQGVDSAACVVSTKNQRSLRWLASLGFHQEAINPGLGNRNRDIPLCAMVRREYDLFPTP